MRYRVAVIGDSLEALFLYDRRAFWQLQSVLLAMVGAGAEMHVVVSSSAASRASAQYASRSIGVPLVFDNYAARSLVIKNVTPDEVARGIQFLTQTRANATRSQWLFIDSNALCVSMAGAMGFSGISYDMLLQPAIAQAVLANLSLNRWNIDRIPLFTN